VPVACAIAALGRAIARRFSVQEDDLAGRWLRLGAVIGLVAIALQSSVEFSLQMPGNAAVFTLLVAFALHRPRPR
jgi:hypothetical protein